MKKSVQIPFWVFHILMKFLPFMLTYEVVLTYTAYEQHPYLCKATALIMLCYAIGACVWDYFIIKKLRAGEKANLILPFIIDAVQIVIASVIFIKHFIIIEEICGYDNFFEFMKYYFKELRP